MISMDTIYDELLSLVGDETRVLRDAPMKEYTTFRAGGCADVLAAPSTPEELAAVVRMVHERSVPYFVLGNGSDVLVRDGGYRGVIIYIGKNLSDVQIEGTIVTAQAGALLSKVAAEAAKASLTGLEFASGIPGSVGGAVFMNAGAYDGEMKMVVDSVDAVLPDGSVRRFSREDLAYGYRDSVFMRSDVVILSAKLQLERGEQEAIYERMRYLADQRSAKQPLDKASAGSTFKRPEGYFAGKLIDDAGCRGLSVGQAQVSPKHAGFIVNNGGATAAEILDLIALVQMKVKEDTGVELHPEVRIIGESGLDACK